MTIPMCMIVVLLTTLGVTEAGEGSPSHSPLLSVAHEEGAAGDAPSQSLVAMVNSGHDALLLRVHLIRNAKRSIDIQTLIWANDRSTRLLRFELYQAALRGVKVRLLGDHIASNKDPKLLAASSTASPNIEIKVYRPAAKRIRASLPRRAIDALLPTGTNQRMHNKALIVDGAIGVCGGRNWDNNYFGLSTGYNFKDRDLLVIGPVVHAMEESFQEYWDFKHSVSSLDLKDVAKEIPHLSSVERQVVEDRERESLFADLDREADDAGIIRERFVNTLMPVERIRFVADAPGKKKRFYYLGVWGGGRVTKELGEMLRSASDTVIIQSPYVVVNRRSRRLFRAMRKDAPDLRIMVSTNSFGAADHLVTYSANYRLRGKVIGGLGFEIYEFKPHPEDLLLYLPNYDALEQRAEAVGLKRKPYASIHAKSYIVDERIAFVGSYNLDPRSFYINNENGFIIEDAAFVQALKEDILRDMAPENSWVVAERDRRLNGVNRQMERLWGLSPIDLWPVRNTTTFELIPGKEPVAPGHEDFYENYRDIGSFPGSEGLTTEQILTRLFKVTGKAATPLL